MKVFNVTEAKDELSRLIDMVQHEPVQVIKDCRPVAVAMSVEEYNRFKILENFWCAKQIKQNISDEGYLSSNESEELLNSLLEVKK
jgi:prevent-host-death family protein